jgi:hypothetical protein
MHLIKCSVNSTKLGILFQKSQQEGCFSDFTDSLCRTRKRVDGSKLC